MTPILDILSYSSEDRHDRWAILTQRNLFSGPPQVDGLTCNAIIQHYTIDGDACDICADYDASRLRALYLASLDWLEQHSI